MARKRRALTAARTPSGGGEETPDPQILAMWGRIESAYRGAGIESALQLAHAIGVAESTVYSWKGGWKRPGIDSLRKIAKLTDVSVDDLDVDQGGMGGKHDHLVRRFAEDRRRRGDPLSPQETAFLRAWASSRIPTRRSLESMLEAYRSALRPEDEESSEDLTRNPSREG